MALSGEAFRKTVTSAVGAAGTATGLCIALTKLRDAAAALLGVEEHWVGAFGCAISAIFIWTFWLGPAVGRWWRRQSQEPKIGQGVFRLHPYDSSDRESFAREDGEHERILEWIRGARDPLLYLGGASGSGKSSLLHAYVLPELEEQKHVCVAVRGVREPLQQIRRGLLKPGLIWKEPQYDAEESGSALARRAAAHLSRSGRRLFLVFDQFEELLILHERESPEVTGLLDFIKSVSVGPQDAAGTAPVCILVMRTDYEGRAWELGLPSERMRENKEVVRPVTEPQAEQFLKRGVKDAAMRKLLVREASNLEETKGHLRYITLNFLGLAAAEAPGRVRGGRTGRGLLRGTVRDWVTEPSIRDHADAVLRPLISDEETKQPLALSEIARASELPQREVERVLMKLERDGLVRRHQSDQQIWEISHDFVARLLQRVLDDLRGSLVARARPWFPVFGGFGLLAGLSFLGMRMYLQHIESRHQWQIAGPHLSQASPIDGRRTLSFRFTHELSDAAVRYMLGNFPLEEVDAIDLSDTLLSAHTLRRLSKHRPKLKLTAVYLRNTQLSHEGAAALAAPDSGLDSIRELALDRAQFGDEGAAALAASDSGLASLRGLYLARTQIGDTGAAVVASSESGLKLLEVLNLNGTLVGNPGAATLAAPSSGLKKLTELDLQNTKVGDEGAAAMAAPNSGLRELTDLYLGGTQVGDPGAARLAAPDSGLKGLNVLELGGTKVGDAGVAALAAPDSGLKGLTWLGLSGTNVGDAGAAALARPDSGLKALATLNLGLTPVGDDGVVALARPDSGLKGLTELHLWRTQVGDKGAAALARPDSGLKALTRLYLGGTKVSEEAEEAIRKAHPNLTVIH